MPSLPPLPPLSKDEFRRRYFDGVAAAIVGIIAILALVALRLITVAP